jgi:4-hydroxy-3-polyprenylbenzoate decarboxylase/2,5-furandicarboxylate decarboxylase 1
MDFRGYLDRLEQTGDLIHIEDQLDINYDVGALCRLLADRGGPAALLHNVTGATLPLAVNLYGERARLACALGVNETEMLSHVAKQLKTRVPTAPFKGNVPRCQEVLISGDDIDLEKLPFPFWNLGDAGRYITAGLVISRHPEFGWNIAHHRGQIYNAREVGVCVAPEHHLRLATDEARVRNDPVQAAFIIGVRPSITIAASSDFGLGDYELDVAGALEGRPIEVVRCKTVDIDVPEDTEIVIEGHFSGEQRQEGPFVEFTGYQTPIIQSPVFTVTAITTRKEPILHCIFAGKPPCETDTLWRELEESEAFDILRRRFPLLTALHRPPSVARDFIGILQISPKRLRKGIVKTLMLATAAVMPRLKFIFCVDDDIDIYNLSEVMWAVATRCDPKADVEIVSNTMTSWLDPSSGGLTGKVFFDATKKEGFRGHIPDYPSDSMTRASAAIDNAFKATAQAFHEGQRVSVS